MLLLTAIGRRSGRPRTVPLLYLRDDDNLIVCNVRPPRERRNPWPLNVRANPEVTVRISGVAEPRVARDARPEELERLWPRLVALWPPYDPFFAQTHERAIFVLERPASKHTVGVGVEHPGPGNHESRLSILPTSQLGRWSIGLAAAFFALVLAGTVGPRGGAIAVFCGLTGGVAALVAIIRERERALTVYAALAPLVFAVGFVVAELIGNR